MKEIKIGPLKIRLTVTKMDFLLLLLFLAILLLILAATGNLF
jgi:hypothetical protein